MTVPRLTGVRIENSSGPALVLGPSLGTSSTVLWARAVALLAPHFSILSVDIPGHGESPAATESFTVGELADAVVATAADAGFEHFFYAGVSLGGQIALELALRHPERVDAVSIICSSAKVGQADAWHERAATVRAQGSAVMVAGSASRWFAPGFIEEQPEHAGALLNSLAHADDNSYALCCEALAASDIRDRLPQLAVPTLALWGELDGVIPPVEARAVAEGVQQGTGIEIAGAAHLAPIERPEAVADALLGFFRKGTTDA
ncbi:3-oxoadipate enol-lactonase [Homoserinimonas aerilata]|uniref:3-oxoadipate enol-lactonase n=1 Tax=Homoserinimonas aerilata TaxID=1162970 RepID=A0A542YKA0_9MICO|nr:alpha/beta fold hydrolase [Homoserinimonas aerilata]TQL48502.1 3-oxoadipate enol-lactonase [Homoserinimonas aerilata]